VGLGRGEGFLRGCAGRLDFRDLRAAGEAVTPRGIVAAESDVVIGIEDYCKDVVLADAHAELKMIAVL
jgi:hypothetical protein